MVLKMSGGQVLENVHINNLVLAAAGNGVETGLDVSEKGAGVDMSVDVATGSAVIGGTTYTESSIVNLAIEAAHATLHRKDLITYDPTTSNPVVTKGTNHAGGIADPIYPPDIPAGDILLAVVEVTANETEITNSEIEDYIIEITRLDELGNPSDNTTLNASTALHGLLKKLPNNAAQYMNGVGGWTVPAGAGDMSKSVYDPNADGIIAVAQTEANNYAHPSARQCTTGTWAWSQITGEPAYCTRWPTWTEVTSKPSTFPPEAHNQSAATITSGILAVARGGTGVADDSYDADKVDGCHAGDADGTVFKIVPQTYWGGIYAYGTGGVGHLLPGTNGYQLTTHGNNVSPTWAAASDLIFSDTHCPKCGKIFQDGDDLILHLIGHNEVGDILTLPMHLSCANEPKKTVMVQRKAMEDHLILDEETGELKVQRMQKTQEKTVTRYKLKEGYTIDDRAGTACKVKYRAAVDLKEALEEIEETIEEPVYEDVEYRL